MVLQDRRENSVYAYTSYHTTAVRIAYSRVCTILTTTGENGNGFY